MPATKQRDPTTPLQCRICGSKRIIVSSVRQMLRRTFRNVGVQQAHLHAAVQCGDCNHDWWSSHATALAISALLESEGKDTTLLTPEHHAR